MKKIEELKKFASLGIVAFLVVAASILFYQIVTNPSGITNIFDIIVGILMPFIIGYSIAYLLNPMVNFFDKLFVRFEKKKARVKLRKALSITVTFILIFGLLSLFLILIVPQIVESITTIISNIPTYQVEFEKMCYWVIQIFGITGEEATRIFETLIASISGFFTFSTDLIQKIMPYVFDYGIATANVVSNIFLGLILSVYFLTMKDKLIMQLKKTLFAFFKRDKVEKAIEIGKTSNVIFSNFFVGKILDSFIIGILCFIGLAILRMPYAVLISVIVGVTNVIPFFGPFLGAIPSALFILTVSPIKAVWFVIFIIILQQFDGNILGPKILGDTIGISSLWVMFAILVGGSIWGVMGMFIGVPVFAVLYTLMKIFIENKLKKKNLPTASVCYTPEGIVLNKETEEADEN